MGGAKSIRISETMAIPRYTQKLMASASIFPLLLSIRTFADDPLPTIAPKPPITIYLHATAIRGTNESIPSNEVSTTNRQFTLVWEYPADELPAIDGFRIYSGRNPSPTNFTTIGLTLSVDWPVIKRLTNIITVSTAPISISITNPPSNEFYRAVLQRSDSPLGPWTNLLQIPRAISVRQLP